MGARIHETKKLNYIPKIDIIAIISFLLAFKPSKYLDWFILKSEILLGQAKNWLGIIVSSQIALLIRGFDLAKSAKANVQRSGSPSLVVLPYTRFVSRCRKLLNNSQGKSESRENRKKKRLVSLFLWPPNFWFKKMVLFPAKCDRLEEWCVTHSFLNFSIWMKVSGCDISKPRE